MMDQYREPNKSVGLIEACSENVIVFAEHMLGIKPYAWQVYFLKNLQDVLEGNIEEEEALAITSRQIGKSTSLAIFALWCSAYNKKPTTIHENTGVCIVSRSDSQAKKLLREIRRIYRFADRFMKDKYVDDEGKPQFGYFEGPKYIGLFESLLSKEDPNNTTTISFQPYDVDKHGELLLLNSKSGSSIGCFPPTPIVLGETIAICLVDEAGHEKIADTFFYDELYPTGDSTDALFIYTSTPWKPAGFFYTFCDTENTDEQDHIFKVMFTIDALKEEKSKRARDQYEKVQTKIKRYLADGKKDEVARSYYCRFVKGDDSYFDPKKIQEAFDKSLDMCTSYQKPCDMGIDFGGKVKSHTVVTISELTEDGKVRRLYHRRYPVREDDSLLDDIADLRKVFNIQRIIPEECPQSDYLVRQMIDKGWEIHLMNPRSEKVKKYGAFRAALNKGIITSYVDEDLKIEMLALEYSKASRQSIIEHATGYNDDMIDSFLMSAYFFIEDEESVTFFEW